MKSYLYLITGWVLYFILHSLLATESIKKYFKDRLGKYLSVYRLIYVLISSSGLYYLVKLNGAINSNLLINVDFFRYIGFVFIAVGISVIVQSFRHYSLMGFVGITNEPVGLKTSGILKHVRHPIYLGTILVVVGYWFVQPDYPTTVSSIIIFIYLAVGIRLEEKKLIRTFGQSYIKYKEEVPAILPRFRR
jgi:protein-S-isoprenylcysteine O-methyltransferase Ste14